MSGNGQRAQLYPFLYGAAHPPAESGALLEHVRVSTIEKARDIVALRRAVLDEQAGRMIAAARMMADTFEAGGKLLAFGNGGSATDARDAVADCIAPPLRAWRSLPAVALQDDSVITAIANDVGFEHVFARQIIAFGDAGDLTLVFSTSGHSQNIRTALQEARRRGMGSIALLGDAGGAIAENSEADIVLIARSQHIPRIQEAHATMWHAMLELVQQFLAQPADIQVRA
ncbi:MAG: SIS domain-containing protein [Longimicrobiales bacterium]